jgi:hypothetical protein
MQVTIKAKNHELRLGIAAVGLKYGGGYRWHVTYIAATTGSVIGYIAKFNCKHR